MGRRRRGRKERERERDCESVVLQKKGVHFYLNGIGKKQKEDGRERESEMRKRERK